MYHKDPSKLFLIKKMGNRVYSSLFFRVTVVFLEEKDQRVMKDPR